MALTSTYVVATGRIPDVFEKIRDGQAPDHFTQQLLKDWGFTSTNDRAFIPLLKALGFLSTDGKPTSRYNDYRAHSRSKLVMGEALKEAYSDIFLIKAKPTSSDKPAIEGKFKSFHNVSDHVAKLMTKTFFGLLSLADLRANPAPASNPATEISDKLAKEEKTSPPVESSSLNGVPGLHYNIQIHLPATKDIEVYNAIFKSIRVHLFDE